MILRILVLCVSLFSSFTFATEQQASADKQALLNIQVGVELSKFEIAATNIEQSIELASQAVQEMAKNPNLSAAQQAKIVETFEHIDSLSATFKTTIKEIPTAIKDATPPITGALDELFTHIQLTIILTLIVIVLILVCALAAVYYWVIKPTSILLLKTTAKVDNLATALQTTAQIVEKNTVQQLVILNHSNEKSNSQ